MNVFHFKYAIGDEVYTIRCNHVPRYSPCPACENGKLKYKTGQEFNCPNCNGGGLISHGHQDCWRLGEKLTVGQQRVQIDTEVEECYMCQETGVGSGTVHYVEDLYPSKEAALSEIVNKNVNLKEWLCGDCLVAEGRVKNTSELYSKKHKREWMPCLKHQNSVHYFFLNGELHEGNN